MAASDYDVAVVGGGLVGVATAWGLAREGCRVVVLDEGDRAVRASRGNFALVWVQSKGLGLPAYAGWTIRSSNAWAGFAQTLKEETGLDVSFQRPGGFHLALSERELEARANILKRLHNQPGVVDYKTEILDHAPGRQDAARHRPRGGGRQLLPARRPRQFAAPVPHLAHRDQRARRRPTCRATGSRPSPRTAASSGSRRRRARCAPAKVALAAGNANMRLAPHGRTRGADEARARPDRRHRAAAAVPALSRRHLAPDRRRHRDDRRFQGRERRSRRPDAGRQRHRGRARGAPCSRCWPTSTSCAPGAPSAS